MLGAPPGFYFLGIRGFRGNFSFFFAVLNSRLFLTGAASVGNGRRGFSHDPGVATAGGGHDTGTDGRKATDVLERPNLGKKSVEENNNWDGGR